MARDLEVPTAELLLDVRTPMELALSPDGARLAFALHATVADEGSFQPSDLYVLSTEPVARPTQLTEGSWCDQLPVWSPDSARLAFLSDRVTPGHQLPYTITVDGGEPMLAASLVGSAESLAWSSDGTRLLVLAADPFSYGLDWSARAVNGAEPEPDPIVRRPGDARRRLFLIDPGAGDAIEVGPRDRSVWEFDWDGDNVVVAIASAGHSGSGWYDAEVVALDLGARAARTLYDSSWQMEGLAISPDASRAVVVEGYASDHGLLAGNLVLIDLASAVAADPWPDLQTVGLASWCDDESLWYASTEGVRNACGRLWLDGRREERWRDDAFIGDAVTTPACVVTPDAADIWTTHQAHGVAPELARFDHANTAWVRVTSFNDRITDGRVFPDVRTIAWMGEGSVEIEGLLMTPRGAEGPLPTIVCVHGGPTWNWAPTSPTPNRMRCSWRRQAMRVCCPTPAGARAVVTRSPRR